MHNVVIMGMKNCGKSTLLSRIAKNTFKVVSLDESIMDVYENIEGERLGFREIHQKHGEQYFRKLETDVLKSLVKAKPEGFVIDCGGGTPMKEDNRNLLKKLGKIIWVKLDQNINYERIMEGGIPSFFKYKDDPKRSFQELIDERFPVYEELANYVLEIGEESEEEVFEKYKKIVHKLI